MNQNKKNFLWNMIGLSFNAFNSLFFLIVVKRINGLELAGSFTYSFAVASLIALFDLYFSRVYQITNNDVSDNTYIKFRLFSCCIGIVISFIIAIISSQNIIDFFIIILLCLFRTLESFADTFYGIMHRIGKLDYVGKSMTIKAIVGLILFILVDYYTLNIILAILILSIVNIIGIFFDYYFSKKHINNKKSIDKCAEYKIIIKNATSICIYSILGVLFLNLQKYVIGFMRLDEISAIFGIVIMPATVLSLCGQYLLNPFINKLDNIKNDILLFKKTIIKLSMMLFLIGIVIIVILYFIGIDIMELLYDFDLTNYYIDILLIVFSSIFYSITSIISSSMTILKQNTIQFIEYLLIVVFSIILSIVLINRYSLHGAVYAYSISMFVHMLIYFVIFKYSLRTWEDYIK